MTPRRILLLGWLAFMLYAFPGFLTARSVELLEGAYYWELTDRNPPLVSAIWRLLNAVWYGPAPMLVLQSGCLLFGSYALLRRHVPPRTAAFASAGVLVFPPVMAAMAVIDADCMLAGFLVAGLALVTAEARRWKLAGLGVMLLACGFRDGAALAVFPLVVFTFVWDPAHRRALRYPLAIGAWAACALVATGLTNVLPERVYREDESHLAMFDIAGMVARSTMTDAEIRALGVKLVPGQDLPGAARAPRARPSDLWAGEAPLFAEPATDDDVEALLAARARLRAHDVGAYAATRWVQTRRLLSGASPSSKVYTRDNISAHQRVASAHGATKSKVQRGLIWFVRLVAKTPLFDPLLYLAIALLSLPFARRSSPALVLFASALLLEVVLAMTTYTAEYRCSTWLVTATMLAAFLTLHRMVSASRTPV